MKIINGMSSSKARRKSKGGSEPSLEDREIRQNVLNLKSAFDPDASESEIHSEIHSEARLSPFDVKKISVLEDRFNNSSSDSGGEFGGVGKGLGFGKIQGFEKGQNEKIESFHRETGKERTGGGLPSIYSTGMIGQAISRLQEGSDSRQGSEALSPAKEDIYRLDEESQTAEKMKESRGLLGRDEDVLDLMRNTNNINLSPLIGGGIAGELFPNPRYTEDSQEVGSENGSSRGVELKRYPGEEEGEEVEEYREADKAGNEKGSYHEEKDDKEEADKERYQEGNKRVKKEGKRNRYEELFKEGDNEGYKEGDDNSMSEIGLRMASSGSILHPGTLRFDLQGLEEHLADSEASEGSEGGSLIEPRGAGKTSLIYRVFAKRKVSSNEHISSLINHLSNRLTPLRVQSSMSTALCCRTAKLDLSLLDDEKVPENVVNFLLREVEKALEKPTSAVGEILAAVGAQKPADFETSARGFRFVVALPPPPPAAAAASVETLRSQINALLTDELTPLGDEAMKLAERIARRPFLAFNTDRSAVWEIFNALSAVQAFFAVEDAKGLAPARAPLFRPLFRAVEARLLKDFLPMDPLTKSGIELSLYTKKRTELEARYLQLCSSIPALESQHIKLSSRLSSLQTFLGHRVSASTAESLKKEFNDLNREIRVVLSSLSEISTRSAVARAAAESKAAEIGQTTAEVNSMLEAFENDRRGFVEKKEKLQKEIGKKKTENEAAEAEIRAIKIEIARRTGENSDLVEKIETCQSKLAQASKKESKSSSNRRDLISPERKKQNSSIHRDLISPEKSEQPSSNYSREVDSASRVAELRLILAELSSEIAEFTRFSSSRESELAETSNDSLKARARELKRLCREKQIETKTTFAAPEKIGAWDSGLLFLVCLLALGLIVRFAM